MSRSSAPILAGLVVVLTSWPWVSGAETPGGDTQAITTLIEKVESANNAGDVDAWVVLFDDEFVYMAPGAPPVTSREQLVEVARTGFRNRVAVEIEPMEVKVLGDWAFARTQVTGTATIHGSGEVVKVDAKQLVIYRRAPGGAWRIARLMSNSNT